MKIVNLNMNKYYTYLHLRKDNRIPFYVGKGVGRRAFNKDKRPTEWYSIVENVGYIISIIDCFDSEEECLLEERKLQLFLESKNILLTNKAICGTKGCTGYNHEIEAKNKISNRSKELWKDEKFRCDRLKEVKGLRNPYADKTIYHFWHPVFGEKYCTQFELRDEYFKGIAGNHVCSIIKGRRLEANGWRLYSKKTTLKRTFKDMVYTFYNSDGNEFIGIKSDFLKSYPELRQCAISRIISGVNKTHLGWMVKIH